MRKDFFYRLCSDLIVVPSLAQRIQENPNELTDLLQVVVQRIVGEPSDELVALVQRQIQLTPGNDYQWPGNVRELEQCVRRIMMKQEYTPLPQCSSPDLAAKLSVEMQQQRLNARALLAGYCLTLYQQHNTIEAVARVAGVDRRTAKKHIETGKRLFETG